MPRGNLVIHFLIRKRNFIDPGRKQNVGQINSASQLFELSYLDSKRISHDIVTMEGRNVTASYQCIAKVRLSFISNHSIHSIQTKQFQSLLPRVSGHTIRCVDAPHTQGTHTLDVEIVIVEKEHSFVRNVGNPLQALEVLPLVPWSDFDVIETR